jgi:hypothetical protein
MTNISIPDLGPRTPAAALGLCLLLGACAAPPPGRPPVKYVAPGSGPTAKLVMRAVVPTGDLYGVYLLVDDDRCSERRMVGVGDAKRNPPTTALAANEVQTVEFALLRPNKQMCFVRWSFTPVPGKSYLLRGLGHPSGCAAVVMDMSDPEKLKPEPTALRRNPIGQACVPLAQSKAISAPGSDGVAAGEGQDAVLRKGAGAEDLQGLIGQ